MDKRTVLKKGTVLAFSGMQCRIEDVIGRGSNGIVYKAWYQDQLNTQQKHHVLIKELFPYHSQGLISRAENGHIVCDEEAGALYEVHRRSFECGNQVHLTLLEARPDQIGENLNTFEYNSTLYTVLGFSGGRSLDMELAQQSSVASLKKTALRMMRLLDALDAFHSAGYLHLDISPDNILLIGQGEAERVILIDFNSVLSLQSLKSGEAIYYSTKVGYTPPEVQTMAMDRIGMATDIYSVIAVFYRCLMGRAMSVMETLRPTPPDGSKSACLADMPETVRSMVKQILQRGLNALPGKRYQSIEELRIALQELIDRIDGKGITHWALWEAGKRNVLRVVRENAALKYIGEEDGLYPLQVHSETGERMPVRQIFEEMRLGDASAALLLGAGGMGKTTALLRAVCDHTGKYSPQAVAWVYVSLYGWKEGDDKYIRNCILKDLKYKQETKGFEDARHTLGLLMDQPIRTREANRPGIMILLDGLNEARGDLSALLSEIGELSGKEGVRLLIAGRTDVAEIAARRYTMEPLESQDVSDALAQNGLLLPENEDVQELLRTPMMLSIFIQAALAGEQQLMIQSRDELMQVYFAAMTEKMLRDLPDNSPDRWKIKAAVALVLPQMAAAMARTGSAMSDSDLLTVVEKCYRLVASRNIAAVFPEWIGHSRDIRGDAAGAEEWYGILVHGILWQRMGVLVRDGQSNYRIVHQIIGEYLAGMDQANMRKLMRRKLRKRTIAVVCILAVMLAGGWYYDACIKPQPYSETFAESVFDYAVGGYMTAASQVDYMRQVAEDLLEGSEELTVSLAGCKRSVQLNAMDIGLEYAVAVAEEMVSSQENGVMPWSNHVFDREHYRELVAQTGERARTYQTYLDVVSFLMQDEYAWADYQKEYGQALSELTKVDARIADTLYRLTCAPHMPGLSENNPTLYDSLMINIGMVGEPTEAELVQSMEEELGKLENQRREWENRLSGSGAVTAYERRGG